MEFYRDLSGRRVIIGGVGGSICVDPKDQKTVQTSHSRGVLLQVELIKIADEEANERNFVAFRVVGTQNKYLSLVLYGDEMRNAAAEALSHTPVLPDLIPNVVDYAVDHASADKNFEGAGFNYQPMTAEDGPPGLFQLFSLERAYEKYGIKTRFGTYWRSQHWNKTVSQSPHCLGDERWNITVQEA
mmetsp:Transcript_16857/g.25498  ORF Transcript_16857/g.25498 Transcript_16857/m.25498 type:complete len:186 (-) Transcript_16857:233-790(-)